MWSPPYRWSRSSWQDAYSIHRCSGSDLGVRGSVTCVDTSLHRVCTVSVSTTSSFCVYVRAGHSAPLHRVTERLLNSYKLETLQGTPLDGLFNARRLRGFIPREGTELAAQQKKFEEELALREAGTVELDKIGVTEPGGEEVERMAEEDSGDWDLGLESSEWDIQDVGDDNNAGFFYEGEEEEEEDDEDIGIGARVAARRRGRLHNGGG